MDILEDMIQNSNKVEKCIYPLGRDCRGCEYNPYPDWWDAICKLPEKYYITLEALEKVGRGKRARSYLQEARRAGAQSQQSGSAEEVAELEEKAKGLYRSYKAEVAEEVEKCKVEGVALSLQDLRADNADQPHTNNRKNQTGYTPIYLL